MPRSCRAEVARARGCGTSTGSGALGDPNNTSRDDLLDNCPATSPKCDSVFCSAYQRNLLPTSWSKSWRQGNGTVSPECNNDDRKTLFNLPEGIGCYSTNVLEPGYDPNWAIPGSIGNIYTAGRQVTNSTFGSVYPSWNVNKVGGNGPGSNYGWSTLAANTGRFKPGTFTSSGAPITGLQSYCAVVAKTPDHCQIRFGETEKCESFCPSSAGGFYSTTMGDMQNNAKGVPGLFRYPEHLVNSLTCVAGTNTVAWVSSSKLLTGAQLIESLPSDVVTTSTIKKCEQYHLNDYLGANSDTPPNGGPPVPLQAQCSECGNLGSNPDKHIYEVGDTTYAGIYTNTTDKDGNNNPFRDGINRNWCEAPVNLNNPSFMLPSKPWGPFNITTNAGYGNPPIEDYGMCGRKTQTRSRAAYLDYTSGSYVSFLMIPGDPNQNVPWKDFLGPGLPNWFFTSCYRSDYEFKGLLSVNGTLYGFNAPNAISFWQLYDITSINVTPDDPNPSDLTYYYDCYLSQKTTACSPKGTMYLWKGSKKGQPTSVGKDPLAHCESSTKWAVDLKPDIDTPGYPGALPPSPISGQQGFTCDCGIDDATNRWCFNNPIISYATGRSYSVSLRACPWSRGLSGEFIWKDSCRDDPDYVNKLGNDGWTNSTSTQVKKTNYIKLWVSGILEDPCPPWPVDVNLNGITCGVYPKWVPVPFTNTNRRADKGQWTGVAGTVATCLATAAWCYTASGHTCGCTAAGCAGCETSWPSGVTGCTLVNNCATVMDFGDFEPPH